MPNHRAFVPGAMATRLPLSSMEYQFYGVADPGDDLGLHGIVLFGDRVGGRGSGEGPPLPIPWSQ